MKLCSTVPALTLAFIAVHAVAADPEPPVETLIDRLTDISEPGYGYSTLSAWGVFLPYPDSEHVGVLVLGSPHPEGSDELERIVRRGVAAVPSLLMHLDDARPTKLPPIEGFDFVEFWELPDRNRRTQGPVPDDWNFDGPESHQVAVGDLCFVALGQIANRRFDASRYVPSGGVGIASPVRSKKLCDAVRADFENFDEAAHRRLLRNDFEKPDDEGRRIGAYLRLAFYYPRAVESLVLKQLEVPAYDGFAVERLIRDTLYREPSPERHKEYLGKFVTEHGPASRDGILLYLFKDLRLQEADEQGRLSPPIREKRDPRGLLVTLYGYPKSVKSTDVPYVDTWNESERARFVAALTHDESRNVDEVVLTLFRGTDDDYTRDACVKRLRGKGHADVEAYAAARDEEERQAERERLERERKYEQDASPTDQ